MSPMNQKVENHATHLIGPEPSLTNLNYDPQCEDNRGEWVMTMLKWTKNPDLYYQSILSHFGLAKNIWDVKQLSTMVMLLAQRGYSTARDLLYEKFNRQEFDQSSDTGEGIVKLDGIAGLLHVANRTGQLIREEENYWTHYHLIESLCEPFGKEKVAEALLQAADGNQNIKAYVDSVIKHCGGLYFDSAVHKPVQDLREKIELDAFLDEFEKSSKGPSLGVCLFFGQRATVQETMDLFALLPREKNREKFLRKLWVFRKALLPEVNNFILSLATSDDDEIRSAAITALAKVHNPVVRDLGLKKLAAGQLEAIELFVNNYEPGDFERIFAKLPTSNDSDDKIHGYGFDLLSITKKHKNLEAVDCLLWFYENNPCAMCRGDIVEELIRLNIIPHSVAHECLHDSNKCTRQAAVKYLSDNNSDN